MKVKTSLAARASSLGLCLTLSIAAAATAAARAGTLTAREQQPPAQGTQPAAKPTPAPVSEDAKAAQAADALADPRAALAASRDFVAKYGTSALRPRLARSIALKIADVKDPAEQLALAGEFVKVFNAPDEVFVINPHMIEAYIEMKRYDEAYAAGTLAAAERFDDPLPTMINLTLIAAEQAQRQNPKFAKQGLEMGLKAVELLEANRKPAAVLDAAWAEYKTKWLAQLYHSLGLLSYVSGNVAEAKAKLAKASELNSTDPYTYVLTGVIANNEYQQLAQQQKAAAGAAKDELLKRALAQMDQVIDAYARAIALAEDNAGFDQLRAHLTQDLEAYYKFRNNGSTDGMKKLIDKYKRPAAPQP